MRPAAVLIVVSVIFACNVAPAASLIATSEGRSPPAPRGEPLPIVDPARVERTCGFDDGAASPSGPWASYAAKHAALVKEGRVLVYVAGEGLGARLRGAAVSLLVAMATNRALQIEWEGLTDVVEPNFLNWVPTPESRRAAAAQGKAVMFESRMARLLKEAGVRGDSSRGRHVSFAAARELGSDPLLSAGVVLPHTQVAALPNRPLRELFPEAFTQLASDSRDASRFLGCASRFLFRLSADFAPVYNNARARLGKPELGIQMRFGDVTAYKEYGTTVHGADDKRLVAGVKTVDTMLQCPQHLHLVNTKTSPTILFASDWSGARRLAAQSQLPGVTVLGDEAAHLDLTLGGSQDASAQQKARAVWTEFLLLAGADALLVSGSRRVTEGLFAEALFNRSGSSYTCRASFFSLGAAALALQPLDKLGFGLEDCHVGCGS